MRHERGRDLGTRHVGRWYVQADTTNRNRLSAFCYFDGTQDPDGAWPVTVGVQFGNGNSDPVWTVGRRARLSSAVSDWVERHARRLARLGVAVG